MRLPSAVLAAAALLVPAAAPAQATAAADGPPATVAVPSPICTDRPTRANVACTVPAGDVQIETDLVNWTRASVAGTQTDTVLYTNPFVKLGVGRSTDLEVNVAPYETVRFRDRAGAVSTLGGVGDLYLRVKQRVTSAGAYADVAIIPYVKAPTARVGIGNGAWEGGTIVAVEVPLPRGFTLTADPEVDVLADADGRGHHASFTVLANLAHSVGKRTTVYGELWTQQNLDPAGAVRQYSFDTALAFLLTPVWQLDLGGNFGLNRATPATQVYLGVSTRF